MEWWLGRRMAEAGENREQKTSPLQLWKQESQPTRFTCIFIMSTDYQISPNGCPTDTSDSTILTGMFAGIYIGSREWTILGHIKTEHNKKIFTSKIFINQRKHVLNVSNHKSCSHPAKSIISQLAKHFF